MRRAVLLAAFVLAAPAAGAAAPPDDALSEGERAACEGELETLERRRRLFEAQGLPEAEIERRNASHREALAQCRRQVRAKAQRELEERQDQAEIARRAGPNATELERERARREVRRERLGARSPSSMTAAERAELAAGMHEELEATHQALDRAHARDPLFMRVIHSALACYHGERRGELQNLISSEEALLKLGSGDRQKLYSLRSELRQSDEVLARSAEAARGLPGGLDRCSAPTVAVVAHCLALRFGGTRTASTCDAEDVQQYTRLVK
jgi:hypothetical protein